MPALGLKQGIANRRCSMLFEPNRQLPDGGQPHQRHIDREKEKSITRTL
jgi:hypothetical protein